MKDWIKRKISNLVLENMEVENRTIEKGLKGKRVLETHVSILDYGMVIEEEIRANGKLNNHRDEV